MAVGIKVHVSGLVPPEGTDVHKKNRGGQSAAFFGMKTADDSFFFFLSLPNLSKISHSISSPHKTTSIMSAVINVQPWLKFTATTVGRDKLYRAVQYFSRFLAWYLLHQGASKETVARFNNLKKTLGLSRKCNIVIAPIANEMNEALDKQRDEVKEVKTKEERWLTVKLY